MAVAKFDDGVPSNTKIIAAGATASWLWFCGVLFCRRGLTDGFIPLAVVPALSVGLKAPMTHAAKLVEVGLWEKVPAGFMVHDFLDWNASKLQMESYRAKDRERKQSKHGIQQDSERNPVGIRSDSERIPNDIAYTRGTHAGGKSESESESLSESVGSSQPSDQTQAESRAPTRDADGRSVVAGVAWGHSNTGISRTLTTTGTEHRRCFFAPAACARGYCIPSFLGDQWVLQAGEAPVAAFVRFTLANTQPGPIGDPLPFWREKWNITHAQANPLAIRPGRGASNAAAFDRVAEQLEAKHDAENRDSAPERGAQVVVDRAPSDRRSRDLRGLPDRTR